MTDPDRSGDVLSLAKNLPRNCALVLRTYGRPDISAQAYELAELAREESWQFLVSADPELADKVDADGVHWPEWALAQINRSDPTRLITASAHSPRALRRASTSADAILISPIFSSQSPSATHPKGVFRASALARAVDVPVYALGGITPWTVKRLQGLGFSGIATVGIAR